jgi:1-acyl-sn-glycerol-3-phosphate acyltransferase
MGWQRELRLLMVNRDWRGRATIPRSAEPWTPRGASNAFPTSWARSPAARAIRSQLQRNALRPLLWTATRPEVHGRDLLESLREPAVFIANHSSHLDAPLILCSLPPALARRTAVGAAADYFFGDRWRGMATALVFNAFPVERRGNFRGPSPVQHLLDNAWNLLLFPEGTRSDDGWMKSFHLGPARQCVANGIPAVPVAIRGSYAAMPRGRAWPWRNRLPVIVRYGRPLWPKENESARDFNARLEAAVARLWVEQDIGWWESLRAGTALDSGPGRLSVPRGPVASRWRRVWESTRPIHRQERATGYSLLPAGSQRNAQRAFRALDQARDAR